MPTTNDIGKLIDERPFTGLQLQLIFACFFLNMLDGYDVLSTAFTAPVFSQSWEISARTLGLILSSSLLGMALGAAFIAPYTDVIGRRAMIFISLIVIGVSMVITGLATSATQMIVLRIMTGLGIGSILASLTTMVAEYSPARSRSLCVGFVMAGYPLGATVGGVVAIWLIELYDWPAVFYFGGLLSLVAIIITYFFLPESMAFLAKRQPPNALERINRILSRMKWPSIESLPASIKSATRPSVKVLLDRKYRKWTLLLWCGFFMSFLPLYFLFSWMPKVMVDEGLPVDRAIYIGTALNFGAFLGCTLLGYLSDKLGVRRSIIAFYISGIIFMLVFALAPVKVPLLLTLSFLIGFCVIGGFVGFYISSARLYPTEIRTTGVGWGIGAGRIAAIIAPYAGGVLIDMGFNLTANFIIFAMPLVIAIIAIYSLRAPELNPG